jgi:hypothetical protein
MKAYGGSGYIDPHFLDLGTGQRWVVVSHSDRFTSGTYWIGGEQKILDPTGTRTPTPRSFSS